MDAIDLDGFVMGKVIGLDFFHDCSIVLAVQLCHPWTFEYNAPIDMVQKLVNVVHPWGCAPLNSIGFL